jgi:sporulation protein YlmC with PRC-barrel domain
MADDKKNAPAAVPANPPPVETYAFAHLDDGIHLTSLGTVRDVYVGLEKAQGKVVALEGNPRHLLITHELTYLPRGSKAGAQQIHDRQVTRVPWANVSFVQDKHIDPK